MREIWNNLNKFYVINFATIMLVISSLLLMFYIQFKVEKLQETISKSRSQINAYEDQIRLYEVEWVYLTRPERLRQISAKYLKNNGYALASQIKGQDDLEQVYNANYRQEENSESQIIERDI